MSSRCARSWLSLIDQIDTTYAVSVCREVWRDRVPSGCPSKIASFWPVSATFVAETGQKRGDLGAVAPPPNPDRVSPEIESRSSGIFRVGARCANAAHSIRTPRGHKINPCKAVFGRSAAQKKPPHHRIQTGCENNTSLSATKYAV